jgi:ParB family transcriptional regulator, chromosome partitioning protein
MPLPTPKKGTAPATARVKPTEKPSRAEMLRSATTALATEQLPEEHTMAAIEGPIAPDVVASRPDSRGIPNPQRAQGDEKRPEAATRAEGTGAEPAQSPIEPTWHDVKGTATLEREGSPLRQPTYDGEALSILSQPLGSIRPSPFQPKGRPSAAAVASVRKSAEQAGSLAALVSPEGAAVFARLDPEAARLAELAFDIAENGVKTPIEVRTTEDGAIECLSGHRRLAAAMLAGLSTVPTLSRGQMSSAAAAATVLRGNLHRENFTTWQEAVLVTEVQERRKADGHRDTVRSLGAVMGWSHGKVNSLLRIRRALTPDVLTEIGMGDGDRAEEALARAAYRDLERAAMEPDRDQRISEIRRMLGWSQAPATASRVRPVYTHRPKRGGGFVIEVHEAVETLAAGDAAVLRELFESQVARLSARLQMLDRPTS